MRSSGGQLAPLPRSGLTVAPEARLAHEGGEDSTVELAAPCELGNAGSHAVGHEARQARPRDAGEEAIHGRD